MQQVRIDFDNPGLPQSLGVVEGESQSRIFQAALYKSGAAYTAPAGAVYSIMYRGFGPQNQGWYDTIEDGAGKRAACTVSGNVVTCELARQALRVPGHLTVVLCVSDAKGYMLKSWPIMADVRNDGYEDTVEIESFFYIAQITSAEWEKAFAAWEDFKSMIDPTLTLSGKAADAKETGDKVGKLKEDLGNITDCERINPSYENHYIATNGDVGSVVNIESPTVYNGFNCYLIPCIAGDKFTVNVTGGSTPRVYAWLKSEKEIIYAYGANETLKNTVLTAPANSGFLVVNDNSNGSVYKGVYVSEKIKEMNSANTNNIAWLKANIQNTIVGNLIDFKKSKRGYYLANDGIAEVENEIYSYTDFIELCGYTTIYRAPTRTSKDSIFLYDVNKNKIYHDTFGSETEYVIPEEYREKTVYFRMNYGTSAGDDKLVMLSYNSEIISKYGYIEHGSYIQKNYILSNPNPMLNDTVNGGQCAIFRKMGFIGDSLSSGEVYKYDGTQYIKKDFYEHSWGQYLARACGSQGFNFSKGGLRVDTWLADYFTGGPKASDFVTNKCEMYTIALAVNDAIAINNGVLQLGTESDIDFSDMNSNANTFYGCYAKIIQYIKSVVPNARIFVITNPNGGETLGLNGAIRYMSEHFTNVYLLDMYKYADGLYTTSYLTENNLSVQGHLTPSGYIRSYRHIASYIDYIIRSNMEDFMDVCYILE